VSRQLLVVEAGGRLYALPSEHVREITTMLPTTRLPGAPPDVRGLVNLRGQLFAVLDLAQRISGAPSLATEPDVIVLSVDGRTLGVVVDEVREVVQADETVRGSDLAQRISGAPSLATEPDVIVLSVDGRTLGVVVDEVREVVQADETVRGSDLAAGAGRLVAGMGHFGDAVVIEVDVRELVRQSLA
jgi:purine-binding chemotaxis protein CheW